MSYPGKRRKRKIQAEGISAKCPEAWKRLTQVRGWGKFKMPPTEYEHENGETGDWKILWRVLDDSYRIIPNTRTHWSSSSIVFMISGLYLEMDYGYHWFPQDPGHLSTAVSSAVKWGRECRLYSGCEPYTLALLVQARALESSTDFHVLGASPETNAWLEHILHSWVS